MTINISIVNKHATVAGAPVIVCGNDNYSVEFTFDKEWDSLPYKTARFVYVQNGAVKYDDVVFVGVKVNVPILANTREVLVGVYAGDLRTSAPARIPCEPSIRCGTGAPADPTPSQYDQIMELLNAGGGTGGGQSGEKVLSDNLFDKTTVAGEGVFSYESNGFTLAGLGGHSRYAFVPLRGAGTYRTKFNWDEHEWSSGRIALTDENDTWVMNVTGTVTPNDDRAAYDIEFTVTQDMIDRGAAKIAFDCWVNYLDVMMIVKDREYPDTYIPYGYIEVPGEETESAPNILTGKTAVFLGDSLCAASTEYEGAMAGYGWAGLVGEANGMTWKNYGKDGGTITDLAEVSSGVWLSTQLGKAYAEHPDADYVIFEGGCNDADRMEDALLGEISTGYDTFDTTTFSGAFEALVLNILNKYPNSKIGYIIPPKMYATNDHTAKGHVHRRFFDRAVEICQKWGIPVIDLWNGTPLNPNLLAYYNKTIVKEEANANGKYYTDGQHLTLTGYKFVAPLIEAWMRNLYMNGDKSGGAASWNDLEDKPFWSEYAETTLIDGTYTREELEAQPFPFVLNEGQTYKVIWNGVEYIETAQPDPMGMGATVIGNMELVGGENTGQPFCVLYMSVLSGATVTIANGVWDENVTLSISTNAETVHKIPDKYIPFAMPFYVEGMMNENGVQCLVSFETIKSAFDNNYYIALKLMNNMLTYTIFPLSTFNNELRIVGFEGFTNGIQTNIRLTWDDDGNCNAELTMN